MDGDQLPGGGGQAVAHAVGAGGPALHNGTGLGAGGGDCLAGGAVAAADQHQLGDSRVRSQGGAACLQHGAAIRQTEAEFIKSHSAGRARRHDDGGHGGQVLVFHGRSAPFI